MKAILSTAFAAVFLLSCTGKYVRPTNDTSIERTEARVERGSYLVNHVAACGACHDAFVDGDLAKPRMPDGQLAGGSMLVDGKVAVFIPNITPHETGIGAWTDDELVRGLRDGIKRDGSLMSPLMPFGHYRFLSDEDVRAVVAYLRTVEPKPQPRPTQPHRYPFPMKMAISMGATHHEPVTTVSEPDRSNKVAYGEYLANVGHCSACHAMTTRGPMKPDDPKFMSGSASGMDLPGIGTVWAPNLTPDEETGIGKVSDEQFKNALRTGMRFDGAVMTPPMLLFVPHLAGMTDEDLDALVAYFRSLRPVKNEVPPRALTAEAQALYGSGAPEAAPGTASGAAQ